MPLTQVSSRLIEDTLRYVLGANGTSDYTFTGKGLTGAVNDPTLTLSRGHTYIFENRNSTNAHPFYIKTSIANGGTNDAYNTGVTNNGGAGGTEIVFTVPHDAPDLLYYQCSSHSSMAGQLKIAGAITDGSITETKLANGSVTSSKLGADCVIGSKIADSQIASEHIVDQAVTLAKLEHGTSSNDGKFLRANNGADPTFETIAQPDLTNLSASNLTSGTVPDARFPATLPAASATNLTAIPAANITGTLPAISAANLTNIPAANITGALPAISGANLTNLPAGGKITRVLVATNSGTTSTNSTSYVEHAKLTVTNVPSNARYVVYFSFEFASETGNNYGAHNHIASYAYAQIQHTGGTITGGNGTLISQRNALTDYYIVPVSLVKYDEASNTTDRTYSIEIKSSTTTSGHAAIAKYGTIVAFEYTV